MKGRSTNENQWCAMGWATAVPSTAFQTKTNPAAATVTGTSPATGETPEAKRPGKRMDPGARDVRMERAVGDVLVGYRIRRKRIGKAADKSDSSPHLFLVRNREGVEYEVRVWPDWSSGPACTCPDWLRLAASESHVAWCKHVMAVIISHNEYRCQMLDLYV